MTKFIGVLTALALVPSAASATVVTIDYSANVVNQGTISGTLSFDTKKINLVRTQDLGVFKILTFESPSFLTSFNIYGTQFSGKYKVDYADLGARGQQYAFYTPVPGVPLNLNFILTSSNPGGAPFPEFGYESVPLGQVSLVDQRTLQAVDGGLGLFTVSYANSVPEPATWAMMIGGFGMIGGALRRRRPMRVSSAI